MLFVGVCVLPAALLKHELFLEQLLLLVVDALLEHLQLGREVLGLGE